MSTDHDLPHVLTVSYVVANTSVAESDNESEAKYISSNNDMKEFLSKNGVVVKDETDTMEDIEAAFEALARNPGFWAKHYPLHPNAKRVKNWMWVHNRYRSQAEVLLSLSTVIPPHNEQRSQTAQAADRLLADFRKFVRKIDSHSEFENTMLFKYFLDEKIGYGGSSVVNVSQVLNQLMEQHDDLSGVSEVGKSLEKLVQGLGNDSNDQPSIDAMTFDVKTKISKYVDDLKAHLAQEEGIIPALWLQLTPKQYKKYRSYLSWKYAVMY